MTLNRRQQREKIREATGYETAEELKRLQFIIDELNDHLKQDTSKKVLEIGCGNGNVSMGIASFGYQTLGVDIDEDSIKTAQKNNRFKNLAFKAEPAEHLSEAEKFDAIVCTEVLEHLVDPTVVLDYAVKYLKHDGIFISTVPNGYGPRELLMTKPMQFMEKRQWGEELLKFKRMFGFGHGTVQSNNPNLEHVQFFTKKRIVCLHEKSGFKLKRFQKSDSFSDIFPYSILARRSMALQEFDCTTADILPAVFSSGLYMSYTRE
ncbi:MAG: methyltransferase domain-containing protein [Owenweeksia sp.]|nr:methyltransferase domain-containing protein [Owenweeksia sp.]